MPPMSHHARFDTWQTTGSRRSFLRVGVLGACGLALPELFHGQALARQGTAPQSSKKPRSGAAGANFGRARRCVLLFLTGGPSQHDTWDMKPKAPAEIRGELRPIATEVPGLSV